jgi:hypothetical protein
MGLYYYDCIGPVDVSGDEGGGFMEETAKRSFSKLFPHEESSEKQIK